MDRKLRTNRRERACVAISSFSLDGRRKRCDARDSRRPRLLSGGVFRRRATRRITRFPQNFPAAGDGEGEARREKSRALESNRCCSSPSTTLLICEASRRPRKGFARRGCRKRKTHAKLAHLKSFVLPPTRSFHPLSDFANFAISRGAAHTSLGRYASHTRCTSRLSSDFSN